MPLEFVNLNIPATKKMIISIDWLHCQNMQWKLLVSSTSFLSSGATWQHGVRCGARRGGWGGGRDGGGSGGAEHARARSKRGRAQEARIRAARAAGDRGSLRGRPQTHLRRLHPPHAGRYTMLGLTKTLRHFWVQFYYQNKMIWALVSTWAQYGLELVISPIIFIVNCNINTKDSRLSGHSCLKIYICIFHDVI